MEDQHVATAITNINATTMFNMNSGSMELRLNVGSIITLHTRAKRKSNHCLTTLGQMNSETPCCILSIAGVHARRCSSVPKDKCSRLHRVTPVPNNG